MLPAARPASPGDYHQPTKVASDCQIWSMGRTRNMPLRVFNQCLISVKNLSAQY